MDQKASDIITLLSLFACAAFDVGFKLGDPIRVKSPSLGSNFFPALNLTQALGNDLIGRFLDEGTEIA